ncbi:MAG: ATP-binding cassette domain-containing protein, partial [Lachnospirales bacterium]
MTLEMKNICKSFGNNEVLKNVDFQLKGGEICALLGENGAGKSTLMNILGGVLSANSGKILIDNKEVDFKNPMDSLQSGIAFIHQELSLINDLCIYENMYINRELKKKSGILDTKKMINETKKQFKKMGLDLDPKIMVRDLDSSFKQIVEIGRALLMESSIIIMDEPTTCLTDVEIKRIFTMMENLAKDNVAIIFISHKLNEVKEICTKYAVLRDGNMVKKGVVKDVTTTDFARYMVGHDIYTYEKKEAFNLGKNILELRDLSGPKFKNINLTVKQGEILGIT